MEMFTSSLLLVLALSWPATSSYMDNSTLQLLINNQLTDSGNIQYYLTPVFSNEARLSLVESFRVMLAPAVLVYYALKNQLQSPLLWNAKYPLLGDFSCSSLVIYGIRSILCDIFSAGRDNIEMLMLTRAHLGPHQLPVRLGPLAGGAWGGPGDFTGEVGQTAGQGRVLHSTVEVTTETLRHCDRWAGLTMSTVQCQFSIVQCPLSSVHFPMFSVQCPMSNVQCPMSMVNCPVSSVQCPLLTV